MGIKRYIQWFKNIITSMNSFFEDIKDKKKIFLNNAELELFQNNHENFFKIWEKKKLMKDTRSYQIIMLFPEISSKLNQYHNKNYNKDFGKFYRYSSSFYIKVS